MAHFRCRYYVLPATFLLSVVPTGFVAFLAYYVNRPEYSTEMASAISRRLGVMVQLREIAFPYPGYIEYRGLVLHDRRGTSLRAGRLRVRRAGKRWYVDAEDVRVDLAGANGQRRSGAGAARIVSRSTVPSNGGGQALASLLEQLPIRAGESIILSATNLRVLAAHTPYSIERLTMCFYVGASGEPHLAGQFRLADVGGPAASFELVLHAGASSVKTFRLNTHSSELPVRLASRVAPLSAWLGDEARLRGETWARQRQQGWEVGVRGRIARVDLRRLARYGLPFHLSGAADWTLERALWKDGRLAEFRGRVRAGPGRVSTELLRALARDAGFLVSLEVPSGGTVGYDRMAFSLSLEGGGVRLEGSCDDTLENVVMVGEHAEPLLQGPLGSVSVLGFARALSRSRYPQGVVPAGFDGTSLMQILPTLPGRSVRTEP